MSTPTNNDEPITERVTRAVEAQANRRASDKAWDIAKPIAIAALGALLLLWREQAIQGTEIQELQSKIVKMEGQDAKIGDLTARARENDTRHEELSYWRRAMEQRVGDLAAAIIEREKPKNIKGR